MTRCLLLVGLLALPVAAPPAAAADPLDQPGPPGFKTLREFLDAQFPTLPGDPLNKKQAIDDKYPIPQDPARIAKVRADKLAWYRRTMLDPFVAETAGSPTAKLAQAAVEAYCVRSTRDNFASQGVEFQWFQAAVGAARKGGVDHPLIRYWATRFPAGGANPRAEDPAGNAGVFRAMLKHLPAAKYGAVWKMHMAWNSFMELKMAAPNPAAKVTPAEVKAAQEQFWKEFAAAAADPTPFAQYEVYLMTRLIAGFPPAPATTPKSAWELTDKALAAAKAPKATRLIVEANYRLTAGEKARGTGYADTVTPEGARVFKEQLTAAEKCLQAAWDLDPTSPAIPTLMIQVLIGLRDDRDEMETWFSRAMGVDPDHQAACLAKLGWLRPQWHGSQQDLFEFGYQCFRTGNWYGGLPLALENPTNFQPDKNNPGYQPFFAFPVKWANTEAIYRGFLKEYPDDRWALTRFAFESSVAGKWDIAAELFEKIGDDPWPGVFKDKADYNRRRQSAKGNAKPPAGGK